MALAQAPKAAGHAKRRPIAGVSRTRSPFAPTTLMMSRLVVLHPLFKHENNSPVNRPTQCCVEIPCTVGSRSGFCRSVSNNGCSGGTFDPGNYCPGSQDIQCCLKSGGTGAGTSCKVGSQSGTCLSVSQDGCAGGHFDPGNYCPGSQDIQCCLKSETGVGTSCKVGSQSGTCLSVSRDGCAGGHFDPGNYCPGSQDVQCCLPGSGGGGGSGTVGQRVLNKAKEAAGLPCE